MASEKEILRQLGITADQFRLAVIGLKWKSFDKNNISEEQARAIFEHINSNPSKLALETTTANNNFFQTQSETNNEPNESNVPIDDVKEAYGPQYDESIALTVFKGKSAVTYAELDEFERRLNQVNPLKHIEASRANLQEIKQAHLAVESQQAMTEAAQEALYLHGLSVNTKIEIMAQLRRHESFSQIESSNEYLSDLAKLQSEINPCTPNFLAEIGDKTAKVFDSHKATSDFVKKQVQKIYPDYKPPVATGGKTSPLGKLKTQKARLNVH